MKVTLYSTGCPKCIILEKKLLQQQVEFETISDVDVMQEKGFTSLPMLEVDGEIMDFRTAVTFVNDLGG